MIGVVPLAKKRKGRPLDGVLLLDKSQGMTSNQALQRIRRLYGAQKAGHTGSLDPLATGVLPICFGEATKFSRYLLDADKGYYTTAKLGESRTTGDSEGELVFTRDVPDIDEANLFTFLERFKGDIQQVPSMFSALKHQGRPLYEYARKGITIDRPARPVTIYRLDIDEIRESEIDLSVECSKGTYIRSLVEDIGSELECGAHVSMLRRFKAGHFLLEDSHTFDDLSALLESDEESNKYAPIDAYLLPTDSLLPNNLKVCIKNELVRSIFHGQAVRIPDFEKSGFVSVYASQAGLEEFIRSNAPEESVESSIARLQVTEDYNGEAHVFIGVAEIDSEGLMQPKRLIVLW